MMPLTEFKNRQFGAARYERANGHRLIIGFIA